MRVVRWFSYGLGIVVILALLAAAWVWIASSRAQSKRFEAHVERLAPPTPAQLGDASRQARTLGCYSCHGDGLAGQKMFDEPGVATIWAPNLTELVRRADDQQLARAIRQGIGIDGRPLLVMPSEVYQNLTDQETAALLTVLRGLPLTGKPTPENRIGLKGHIGLALDKFRSAPELVGSYSTKEPLRITGQEAGHRLAVTRCSGCHGADLTGGPRGSAPDLAVVEAYDLAAFTRLLRTGLPPGNRDLDLMDDVARSDFSHLHDQEIAALHAYLQARAQR